MKNKITVLSLLSILVIALIASDHVDAPSIIGDSADIADFYAFEGEDTENIAFIVTLQGILDPINSEDASFDQNVVTQINIDTNNDNEEDLVIQAVRRGNQMWFFGPEAPSQKGATIEILNNSDIQDVVEITPYQEPYIAKTSTQGLKYFAGVTDDPFFFNIATFRRLRVGNASRFEEPGSDTWNGLNVLSVAVEVPKSLLGGGNSINAWASSHRRQ